MFSNLFWKIYGFMKSQFGNYWNDHLLLSFEFIIWVSKAEQDCDPNKQIFTKIEITGTSEEISEGSSRGRGSDLSPDC